MFHIINDETEGLIVSCLLEVIVLESRKQGLESIHIV